MPILLFVQWKAVVVAIGVGDRLQPSISQLTSESPAPPPPTRTRSLKPGTRLLIVDMDVPKILALMVILLLNVQYSQTQGTYIGN